MEQGHYILIIEDSRDEREAMTLTLQVEGYNVVAVAEGREALDYMRGAAPPPCMILLDLVMAGMNGWEFRAEQLRDSRLSLIPVIVCSGAGTVDGWANFDGVLGFHHKPVDPLLLLTLARRCCSDPPERRPG